MGSVHFISAVALCVHFYSDVKNVQKTDEQRGTCSAHWALYISVDSSVDDFTLPSPRARAYCTPQPLLQSKVISLSIVGTRKK